MTLETTINDLIEQNTKLGRERAAAVNHFTCILALAPPIFRAKAKLERFWQFSDIARGKHKEDRRLLRQDSTFSDAYLRDSTESRLQCHQRRRGQPRRDQEKEQMLFCPEGFHDDPLRNPGWWRTTWGTSGCKWMEESLEVW